MDAVHNIKDILDRFASNIKEKFVPIDSTNGKYHINFNDSLFSVGTDADNYNSYFYTSPTSSTIGNGFLSGSDVEASIETKIDPGWTYPSQINMEANRYTFANNNDDTKYIHVWNEDGGSKAFRSEFYCHASSRSTSPSKHGYYGQYLKDQNGDEVCYLGMWHTNNGAAQVHLEAKNYDKTTGSYLVMRGTNASATSSSPNGYINLVSSNSIEMNCNTLYLKASAIRTGKSTSVAPVVHKGIWDGTVSIAANSNWNTGYVNMPAGYIPLCLGRTYCAGSGNINFLMDDTQKVSGDGDSVVYKVRVIGRNVTGSNFSGAIRINIVCIHHSLYS